MDEEEEGESWKPNPTRDACKAMYEQWNEVVLILKAAFDSLKEPKTMIVLTKNIQKSLKHRCCQMPSRSLSKSEAQWWICICSKWKMRA